MLLKITS